MMPPTSYATTRRLTREKPVAFDALTDGPTTFLKTPDSKIKIAEGGLRLLGKYKTSSDDKQLITVITVVYNGADLLEDTIKSVIGQTYGNVEYVIIDGGSTDDTLDIIRKYEHAIDYWVSEPDEGIYDAMNKGIDLGSGDWINFMNAGDYFFDENVLSKIFDSAKDFFAFDVVYGDHAVRYAKRTKLVKAGKTEDLWKGSQFCHQSAFVSLRHHKENKFNPRRKIAADFEIFYKAERAGLQFLYQPRVIAKVGAGGISDTRRIDSILEWWEVVEKTGLINIFYSWILLVEIVKTVVKKFIRWLQ